VTHLEELNRAHDGRFFPAETLVQLARTDGRFYG
jgi:hypothetical protein